MEQTVSDGVVGGTKSTHIGVGVHPPRDATRSLLLPPAPLVPLVPLVPLALLVPLVPLVPLVF